LKEETYLILKNLDIISVNVKEKRFGFQYFMSDVVYT